MSKLFGFTNYKGGVGKSTSATNIALGLYFLTRRQAQPICLLRQFQAQTEPLLKSLSDTVRCDARQIAQALQPEAVFPFVLNACTNFKRGKH